MSFAATHQRASFENVQFLVETESVERGKKYTLHEYPNSDQRYAEELGTSPSIFSITAIVYGEDAINRRLRLESALEKKGMGLLVHPIYGRVRVMALNFSVSSDQTTIGFFTFNIRFARSLENITATPATPTANELSGKANIARNAVNDALERVYAEPRSSFNYNQIIDTTQGVLDEVNDRVRVITDLSSKGASNFNRTYRAFTNGITRIVASAQEMRTNLTDFYAAALDAPVFVEQLGAAFDNLLEYPLTVPVSSPLTVEQSERKQSDLTVVEHMKITSLIGAYESKVHTDYTTDDELTADRKNLDTNYRSLLTDTNNQISEVELTSLANDPEVRSTMADLRVTARKIFDEKEKAVFRIVEINPGRGSMSLTCFRYYGSLDNLTKLTDLNPSISHANFYEIMKALA